MGRDSTRARCRTQYSAPEAPQVPRWHRVLRGRGQSIPPLLQTATQASRVARSGSRVRFSDTEGWTQDFQTREQSQVALHRSAWTQHDT